MVRPMREITGKRAFIIRGPDVRGLTCEQAGRTVVILRVLVSAIIGVAALGILPSDALAMSVKFSWKGSQPCSTRSPAFIVSEVPNGTAQLVFKMVDKDVPTYPHGGGIVAFTGNSEIPAGAFSYRGPCPPNGQQHVYEWTVQALDGKGKALASATIVERFPPG
jgi:hypothetical protein